MDELEMRVSVLEEKVEAYLNPVRRTCQCGREVRSESWHTERDRLVSVVACPCGMIHSFERPIR